MAKYTYRFNCQNIDHDRMIEMRNERLKEIDGLVRFAAFDLYDDKVESYIIFERDGSVFVREDRDGKSSTVALIDRHNQWFYDELYELLGWWNNI